MLKTLKACAGQMAHAFEDVLGFSKLEYGYVKVEKRSFQLRRALMEVVELNAAAAEQRGCRLEVDWPANLVDGFVGDRRKIKTIVGNFVGNALKYAAGQPVAVRVEAVPADGGLVNLVIEVVDHGPGIPVAEQELIFKKFVRGSAARETRVSGTGLGLATCQVLAQLMNGSVGIESTPGKGAMFYLKLLVPKSERNQPLPEAPAETRAVANGRVGSALIVEDEAYNQAVLQGIALELGFKPDLGWERKGGC